MSTEKNREFIKNIIEMDKCSEVNILMTKWMIRKYCRRDKYLMERRILMKSGIYKSYYQNRILEKEVNYALESNNMQYTKQKLIFIYTYHTLFFFKFVELYIFMQKQL